MTLSSLSEVVQKSLIERNFNFTLSNSAIQELQHIHENPIENTQPFKDMRDLLWFSLDNVNTKDLDQLTYVEFISTGKMRLYVAIADVDILAVKGSALDDHAKLNSTSIYTPLGVFSMLPKSISNELASLKEHIDRRAIIVEMLIDEGKIASCEVYAALVNNRAKLAYETVSEWLETGLNPPDSLLKLEGLADQVKLQDQVALLLKKNRHLQGALSLEIVDSDEVIKKNEVVEIKPIFHTRGRDLIEHCMIAANTATTQFLETYQSPTLQRVVRIPKDWNRLRELAAEKGVQLPLDPDAKALENFLAKEKMENPKEFSSLSLSVLKLLGKGEYVASFPGDESIGHFGLAVKNYSHSTAPSRRYADLVTQRLLKGVLEKKTAPYSREELMQLAQHCTERENEAEKVERKIKKSAVALFLSRKLGESFEAIVTGASPKGTWVRLFSPVVEGKVVEGFEGLEVGNQVKVQLKSINVENGYIDFKIER
jgi:exoribonuclease II